MRLHLVPLFVATIVGLDSRTAAFSLAGVKRELPMPRQAGSRVCPLRVVQRWRRAADRAQRQKRLVPKMKEKQEDARDAINDRMASEFERVSFELSRMGQLEEDEAGYQVASRVSDARTSNFTADGLLALQSLLGKEVVKKDEAWVLEEDDYPVASRISDGSPSSFTADELVALQSLLGQEVKEDDEAWHHGKTLACGGEAYSSSGHSAVVAKDGRLFTWGSGGSVRLGRQSADVEVAPAAVGGLLDLVRRQAVRVRAVSCGFDHSACVTEDGRVFVWGSGDRGQVALDERMTACACQGSCTLQLERLWLACRLLPPDSLAVCCPLSHLTPVRAKRWCCGHVGCCGVGSWGWAACRRTRRLRR